MKTIVNFALCLGVAFAVTACGSKDEGAAGGGETTEAKTADAKLDGGQQFLLSSGTKSLAKVKAKLAAGEKVSGIDCAVIKSAVGKLEGVKHGAAEVFVKSAKQACGYDAPISNIKMWKTDIAAKAKEGGAINSKCFDVRRKDLERLQKSHPEDAIVKDVGAYYLATCKKKK